ncbi:MAG: hypothetical protein A2W22_06215 [Candidatus Levybacteria bacterium RBG_16_35_11]|nr:MAG: hypothetical protein A2W22_06215 [Candidatus Levybacteria bacterium RBG_16_35_11]
MPETPITTERGIIRPGVTLKDLVQEREYRGDPTSFVVSILSEWHTRISPGIQQELSKPIGNNKDGDSKPVTLKTDKLFLSDTNLQLLGVIHGLGIKKTKSSYGELIRNYVAEAARNGFAWFIEEGIKDFDVPATSLTDMCEYVETYLGPLLQSIKGPKILGIVKVMKIIKDEFVNAAESSDLSKEAAHAIAQAHGKLRILRNLGYALQMQNIFDIAKLPEPLSMEIGLALLADKKGVGARHLGIERSMIQARQLRELVLMLREQRSQEPGENINVGFICGDFHRSEVKYLIAHPNYNPHSSLQEAKALLA